MDSLNLMEKALFYVVGIWYFFKDYIKVVILLAALVLMAVGAVSLIKAQ